MKDITQIYGDLPFLLTEGQDHALREFTQGEGHYSLLGSQGSGKTTIMYLLDKYYGNEIIFCASSGTASKQMPNNIGSGTAHSVLSLMTEMSTPSALKKINRNTQNIFATSSLIKIIVVDEAYAMDSDKLYTMLKRVERFNKKTAQRESRSIRLLLVGDCLQRLPILSEAEKQECRDRHGHHLMFKSKLWKDYDIKTLMLTEVTRQEDKVFKACLDVIRYGQTSRYPKALEWINRRVIRDYDDTLLLLAPTNRIVTDANNLSLSRNPNPKGNYIAEIIGRYSMKDSPLEKEVVLAVGSPVIGLINQEDGDFCNGSYGHIISVGENGCEVDFTDSAGITFVEIATLTEEETYIEKAVPQKDGTVEDEQRKKVVGTCSQIPLKLAASFTIARSQGRTFTCPINIDVGTTWLYTSKKLGDFGTADVLVALSRATHVENITLLRPILPDHIKVCRESIDWWLEMEKKQNSIKII